MSFHHLSLDEAFPEGIRYRVDAKSGCWIWLGAFNKNGYGLTGHGSARFHYLAHRALYMAAGNDLIPGSHIHHRCENKKCVNPAHLEQAAPVVHLTAHHQFESDLSWEDVREIRRLFAEERPSIEELAERFGIGKSQVHNILRNRKWIDPEFVPGFDCECDWCGETFRAHRHNARFCCTRHRHAWYSWTYYQRSKAA